SAAVSLASSRSDAGDYDWTIIGDDVSLRLLRDSADLSPAARLQLAPVVGADHFDHLGSGNSFAQRLSDLAVPSPRFRLAASAAEAAATAELFGGTVLLKPDVGSGGAGIILAEDSTSAAVGWHLIAARQSGGTIEPAAAPMPVLVQEYLVGRCVDVSAIFMHGQPIHYTYSSVVEATSRLGVAAVRHYTPTSVAPAAVLDELSIIGAGLGLHGFANITCIESSTATTRHYFEVDARPNLWAAFGAEFGDDPARRLRLWFDEGRVDLPAADGPPTALRGRDVAMFKRLSRNDILLNRHGVWRDLPWGSPEGRRLLRRTVLR
ncbi:MAG: hypothetical protein RLZ55_565, partial [Actinomycetota bacterium]